MAGNVDPTRYSYRDVYDEFIRSEGIPVIEGFGVDCLAADLAPWPRLGGLGAWVHLAGMGEFMNLYIAEIPAGQQLAVECHVHDELIYVLQGRGSTQLELAGGRTHIFEWGAGSLFGIPLNTPHRHFNVSGSEPVRFVAGTNIPILMKQLGSARFIFENPFVFDDRFGEERYFRGEGELFDLKEGRHLWHQWGTNFVPDLRTFALYGFDARGAGSQIVSFGLAGGTGMNAHMAEMPSGAYKKAHRHSAGAHIFCITGHGYSLLWREGEDPTDTIRVDWKPGTVFAPPDSHFHQHFNTAPVPARYMAFHCHARRHAPKLGESHEESTQIEYQEEDARVRRLFDDELSRNGVASRMEELLMRASAAPFRKE